MSRENNMTKLPIRLANEVSLHTMPINKQIADAAKLNSTRTRRNLKNSGHAVTKPTMGYRIVPIIIGGKIRRGTMSNMTLAVK